MDSLRVLSELEMKQQAVKNQTLGGMTELQSLRQQQQQPPRRAIVA